MRHCLLLAAGITKETLLFKFGFEQYQLLANRCHTKKQQSESWYYGKEGGNNGYGKVLYFSKHYIRLQNILPGFETRICTSLQKQYIICIKQYIHVFQLMVVCTTANTWSKKGNIHGMIAAFSLVHFIWLHIYWRQKLLFIALVLSRYKTIWNKIPCSK